MYVCVYVCTYLHMYICTYVCMYACMHACMYVCRYVCMYVCTHIHTHTYIYIHMYIHTDRYKCPTRNLGKKSSTYLYTGIHTFAHACLYASVRTHKVMNIDTLLYASMQLHMLVGGRMYISTPYQPKICSDRQTQTRRNEHKETEGQGGRQAL